MSYRTLPPASCCRYIFVGEGAANIVFKIFIDPRDDSDDYREFQGRLLRVPKAGTLAYPYVELQQYWETVVRPLFSDGDLVHQHIVFLGHDGGVITRLNEVLPGVEASRRHDFRGSRVADVEYGMLVEDMDKKHPDDIVFEFKPKWLAQSPNAPSSATRCRNCAREAHKRSSNRSPPGPKPNKKPIRCPLDLVACAATDPDPDPASLVRSLDTLTLTLTPRLLPLPHRKRSRLARWLQTNTLLPRLRDLQREYDSAGPLNMATNDDPEPAFQLAMTLRDCSCFVRIPADDPDGPVEARLADLDKKNWEAKLGYWQATERGLIEGGFYDGTEEPRQETDCLLERKKAIGKPL